MVDCLFCRIIAGTERSDIVYRDDDVVVFRPPQSKSRVHLWKASHDANTVRSSAVSGTDTDHTTGEDDYWEVAWAPGMSFDERGGLLWPRDVDGFPIKAIVESWRERG